MNENVPPVQTPPSTQDSGHGESTNPESQDVKDNKGMAMIAYLGILCFVPLLLKKDSVFAQYHGKQGLVLLIGWVAVNLLYLVPILGWMLMPVGQVLGLILTIVGMVNVWHGDMKELPWIGQFAKHINL